MAGVHYVFCPKRRKKVLIADICTRLFQIWQELAVEKGWNIRALEIAPDHVPIHLVVKAFKGRSSNYLRKEFPQLTRLPSLWSRSYFFCTAGNVSAATIQKYIEDPHHR